MQTPFQRFAQFDVADLWSGRAALLAQGLFGLACTGVMILERLLVTVWAPTSGPYALVYPFVLISTLYGRWQSGVVTYVSAFVWIWYYLVPVQHSFQFATQPDLARTIVNGISAMVILILAEAFRGAVRSMVRQRDHAVGALRELNLNLEREILRRSHVGGRSWSLSPEILGVANTEGFFEDSNPAWATVLGWSHEEVSATPLLSLVHPDDVASTSAGLSRLTRGEPVFRFENRYRCKDGGYRWLSWVALPEGGRFYCSARDITAQKDQEAELAAAHEALRQSQKMEAVGQLTGGLAHDFNNLLAGISGSLELLQKRIGQGRLSGLERYIDGAQASARRAAALTQRLLAFARRQTLAPKLTDANRLIHGMEELLRRSVGPDVRIEVRAAGNLGAIEVDPSQLENALLNLSINARDAMAPAGGRLTIETADLTLAAAAARDLELTPGPYVCLSVADTGSGMAPEVAARVFDPFFTTKPLGQGTGLGLSMVYGFARQSGGQVQVWSEVGRGTVMRLYLPRHAGAEAQDEAVPAAAAEVGAGETVLVVDDEDIVRMLVAEVLTDSGYAVLEAEDGPSGLKVLGTGARIDLLVTDVGLPGSMNGRQLADAARVARPSLKVLFITGYAESAVVGGGLDDGMDVMTKPFEMTALAAKVRELIDREA